MPTRPRRIGRRLLGRAAPYIPLAAYRRLMPHWPVGFFYHVISDEPLPHVRHLYPYKSTAEFEADLRWLARSTTLLDYPALLTIAEHGGTMPSRAAFLSFDDGFAECFSVVRPILKKHGLPGLFFLTTDWIDNQGLFYRGKISLAIDNLHSRLPTDRLRIVAALAETYDVPSDPEVFYGWLKSHQQSGEPVIDAVCETLEIDIPGYLEVEKPYLNRAQILEMQTEGFVFGAHSRRHAKFSTLPQEDQAAEIVASCRIVAEITGADSVPFAFPFSGSQVDRTMLQELQSRYPVVGPIFDSGKFKHEPGIFHRIWVDKPVEGVRPEDNLLYWLRDAYQRQQGA
jgi:peptidoglycan/xylan/chitin deacetylase (PgdA/CDA1 family)